MRLVVVGRSGQVARSLAISAARRRWNDVVLLGRPGVDLEQAGAVARAIENARPDLVINAAAYTAVDQAEDEPARAFRINADAAGEVAAAAAAVSAPIIHLSTDYVFDGTATSPIPEDAPTNPLGVYGASKLAGEKQVRAANAKHLIVRTSWVYSPFGANFVKTMLRLASDRDTVRVVDDQMGCPTSAPDLAEGLLALAMLGQPSGLWGSTMHLAGAEHCSWADFAEAIFAASSAAGGHRTKVDRITTSEYPTRAPRPAYSVLDSSRAEADLGVRLPSYRQALPIVLDQLRVAASGS